MASTTPFPISTAARLLVTVLIALAVVAAGASVEAASVSVTWNAPTTNADGTRLMDLAGYRIYLGTAPPTCPSPSFHTVSSPTRTPAAGQTFSTSVTALRAGTTYFARVTAVDIHGNESACSSSASGAARGDFDVTPTATTTFGSVTISGTVDRTFTVRNTSSVSISGSASVGAPFSLVSGGSFSLAPGASQTVTVRFRPTTVGGFAGNVNFIAGSDSVSRGLGGSATAPSAPPAPPASLVRPVPVARSLSPTGAAARSAGLTLTVNGSGFVASSVVRWNGAFRTTTFVSANQLRAAIIASDLAAPRSVPVSVVTPVPGGGTSGTVTFTITARPAPTAPPPPPGAPRVTRTTADSGGVTFTVAWGAVSGATSYRYVAAFNDGSAPRQGSVTGLLSFQLRMPYHVRGAAFGAAVCIRSVSAAGQPSTNQSCSAVPVPARPVAPPPPPSPPPPPPEPTIPPDYGWGVG